MNYESKRAEIENEIKALTAKLETLKKQESKEAWKNSLIEKFKEFIENKDFEEVSSVMVELGKVGGTAKARKTFYFSDFFNEPESTAKVETEPKAEPTAEETNENQIKVGDYVFYRNIGETGEVVSIIDGLINMKTTDGKIHVVRPEWICKIEKPAEKPENKVVVCSVPKPNETTEEKPVKMKMTLDEFIDSLPEPAQK